MNKISPYGRSPTRRQNLKLGNLGESIAADYLKKKGYRVIERNCRSKWGEIDLVCNYGKEIVFVEVKARIGEQFGLPEDAVNKEKIKRLIKNSQAYMFYKAKNANMSYRIDAICLVLDENMELKRINHYENITL